MKDETDNRKQDINFSVSKPELFRILTDNSFDIISILAVDGTIKYESKATQKILGYPSDSRIGKNVFDYVHPEDVNYVLEEFKNRSVSSKTLEFRFWHEKGYWVWLEAHGQNFLDYPDIQGIIVNSRDITKRKETEFALKASEQKYRYVVETAQDAIYLFSDEANITDVNEMACTMLKRSKEELVGASIQDIDPNFTKEAFLKFWEKIPLEEKHVFETKHLRKDGTLIPLEVSGKKFLVNGRENYYGIARDISERKKAEQLLKEKERRYRALFEQSAAGIAVVAPNREILEVNEKFCELLGYPREELIGLLVKDITEPEDTGREQAISREILSGSKDAFNIEKRYVRKNGERIWVNLSSNVVRDDKGNIRFVISTVVDVSRQKEAEEALKESEKQYRTIVESVGEGIVSVDENEQITFASKSAEQLFGLPPKALINRSLKEFFSPYQLILKETKKRRRGERSGYELELHWPDGTVIPVLVTATPRYDDNGHYIGSLGVIRDISDLKKAEKALKESEEALKIVIENMPFAVFAHNMDGEILFVNKKSETYTGYPRNELLNMQVSDIDQGIIVRDDQANIWQQLYQGRSHRFYSKHTRRDGSVFPVEINVTAIVLKDEPVILAIAQDITERQKAEQAIKESEEKFRLFVENCSIIVRLTDEAYRINYANPVHKEFYKTSNENIIGKYVWDFLWMYSPDRNINDRAKTREELKRKVLEFAKNPEREVMGPMEVCIKNEQGEIKYFSEKVFKVYTSRGVRLAATDIDLTEQKRQELKLKELNATKDKFFSIISHDLRNPISNVVGFTDYLENNMHTLDKEKIHRHITRINQMANKGYQLLDDLLMWSRSQSNNIQYNPEAIDFGTVVHEVVQEEAERAEKKNIAVNQPKTDTIWLKADKNMLKTILRNLFTNAVKFTPENGEIGISAEYKNDIAIITVWDTGVGISPENQEKLWKMTEPLTTQGTAGEKGTGLGLTLCREFVEKHGGSIWAESQEGKGSKFSFTMPLMPETLS